MKTKTQFTGRHWETGSIHNALAAQGVKAPHTGKPYSEALLLGVSGGIAFGYFTFEYKGYLPHAALLTRNTFSPFNTILERLGIAQDVQQSNKADIAEKNLQEVLATGLVPLVWADYFSLPYNDLPYDKGMWGMLPVLAIETDGKTIAVADRSSQPFHVTTAEFTKARARVKEDKFRMMTLDTPQTSKLAGAVHKGICQTIKLFTEEPPRGARDNFGFAAYNKLAELLVNTRNKQSWERYFEPGVRMYHALAGSPSQPGAYFWVNHWGSAGRSRTRAVRELPRRSRGDLEEACAQGSRREVPRKPCVVVEICGQRYCLTTSPCWAGVKNSFRKDKRCLWKRAKRRCPRSRRSISVCANC